MNRKLTGYLLGTVAAATYGMNPLFTLPLYAGGMDADSVLFFRYLLAIPILAVMLRVRGRGFALGRGDVAAVAAAGIIFAMSSLLLFLSYNYMAAGIASTLLFVYPLMVAVIMAVLFHERLRAATVLCLAMALGGIGLLYKGTDGATLSPLGTGMVMASSLAYAVYIVAVNRSRLKSIPTLKLTFYVLVFGWLLFAVRSALGDGIQVPPPSQPLLWLNLVALALLPTAVSLICTTAAIQAIGSTPTAILGAMEPVTAIIFGITVFGERLTPRDVAGLVLILTAVSLVVLGDRLPTYLTHIRRMFPSLRHIHRKTD